MKIKFTEKELRYLIESCTKTVLTEMARIYGTPEFIASARRKHNNRYDYSKTICNGYYTPVIITCPKHGDFLQTPRNHIRGHGCSKCRVSKLERMVKNVLENIGVNFIEHYKCQWLGNQHLDFYLPDYNAAIECQGIQHFYPVKHFGGEEGLFKQLQRDMVKRIKYLSQFVNVLEIKYNDNFLTIKRKVECFISNLSKKQ